MTMRPVTLGRLILLVMALGLPGCQTPPTAPSRALPALSMIEAIRIPDANTARITKTIRATGAVDGHFTHEGRRRSYSLDGVLFFLAPEFVRFDLKKLGDRQLLFGSNEEQFWIYNKQDKAYACWGHNERERLPEEMPIRPDQIADALGLRLIGDLHTAEETDIFQRIVEDSQQILVVLRDAAGRLMLEKEYWLDRFAPRLVRRVVFRDAEGNIELTSTLGDYRPIEKNGPLLPYEMEAEWPRTQARMRFRVSKWSEIPQVGPSGPQFATPKECMP